MSARHTRNARSHPGQLSLDHHRLPGAPPCQRPIRLVERHHRGPRTATVWHAIIGAFCPAPPLALELRHWQAGPVHSRHRPAVPSPPPFLFCIASVLRAHGAECTIERCRGDHHLAGVLGRKTPSACSHPKTHPASTASVSINHPAGGGRAPKACAHQKRARRGAAGAQKKNAAEAGTTPALDRARAALERGGGGGGGGDARRTGGWMGAAAPPPLPLHARRCPIIWAAAPAGARPRAAAGSSGVGAGAHRRPPLAGGRLRGLPAADAPT